MTTTSVIPDTAPSFTFADALRAIKAFAGAAVSVILLGAHTDERPAV
ncbi:hypothetical protein [Streptomyces hesseae]|uniref:Uncharacterized protein n=1 Tax=Streptomyces hesseae TaxID=3075519 RepID=A0ABU2SY61_9ACTN|nr:hypothetical protein [Streptomyces sp. DSM 40473]MDT0453939.1 hypothetical protein [Streptomyces sp. DSM 40473]